MGCDIHLFVERFNKDSEQWESLMFYKKNSNDVYEPVPVYDDRNYVLFGLLAGVRGENIPFTNGYGYLVRPRGIPENLSPSVQSYWDSGISEWHTPTWYDYCELETYAYLLNDFKNVLMCKDEVIENLESKTGNPEDDDGYVEERYDYLYDSAESLQRLMVCINQVLERYNIYRSEPNEIRIVMWFDN